MKLNNLSRLTALLLALTMILSSVAWADPVAEGDYTADNYAEQLAAQTGTCAICVNEMTNGDFPSVDHKGNAITITCGYAYLESLGSPMERYNFLNYIYNTLLDSTGFAALYTTHEQHMDDGASSLLCTCANRANTDLRIPGPENHTADCPWVDGTVVIIPNIPQPDPVNPDLFEQYTSNEEYDLPMAGDRAIILPEGGRAVIKSNQAEGFQWQVYDGTQWVSIQGETGAELVVTTAKLATIFDLTSIAEIRYFDKANDVVMASVSVVSQEIAGGEYVDPVEEQSLYLIEREGEAAITYNVVINYQYENGAIVDNPYTANLAAGTSFSTTVTFPIVQGYLAYFGDDATASTSYTLNITNIQADLTYTVMYKPTNVEYIVYHYQQNIYDDKYSEATGDSPDPKEGLTGSQVPAVHNTYDGFYHLLYEQPNIAADGSTKVVVYYDRYYYLMTFDLDGGYGVEPIYTRYGAEIGDIPTPTKAGYIFGGWDLVSETVGDNVTTYEDGVADEVYAEMPAKNVKYKAIWTTDDTHYTVVYWLQNANPDADGTYGYSVWGSKQKDAKTGTYVNGDDDVVDDGITSENSVDNRNATYNASKTETNVLVEGDGSTVVNVYYDRVEYTLKFYYAMDEYTTDENDATHYVIGGSTYYFGYHNGADNQPSYKSITNYYMEGGSVENQRGEVDEIPQLNANGSERNYVTGYDSDSKTVTTGGGLNQTSTTYNYKYYYISFKAKYGADISELWPCDVINSVTRTSKNGDNNGWSGTEAFVSAWNGEYRVYYSQSNSNETIKGNYNQLDTQLLWNYSMYNAYADDDNTIEYLCFWENGAPGPNWNVPELYRYKVWVPTFNNTAPNGEETTVYNGTTYYLRNTYDTVDNSTVAEQTPPAIEGLTYTDHYTSDEIENFDTSLYKEAWEVNFFYTRNEYTLTFVNADGNNVGDPQTVQFEQDISTMSPDMTDEANYPTTLEAGSQAFVGWYTSNEYLPGTEFSLDGAKMPANNVTLYAKWEPVTHNVTFYLDETKLYDEPLESFQHTGKYQHDAIIGKVSPPNNGSYKHAGWFYKDEDGTEKAFDPENMPIKQDMHVYAKWSSNVLEEYVIFYKFKQADGTVVEIADQISASGLAGTTKTFDAKAGDELYTAYQEGYFPLTPSHSLTIEINVPTADEIKNPEYWYVINGKVVQGFTFWYVKKDAVPYTVRYLIKNEDGTTTPAIKNEDGSEFIKTVSDNRKAVVTETFEPVSGYMPDAYQKRLVVSGADGAANEIIFYYTKDELHAYYQITHYTQNLEGEDYTEYASSQAVGDIGKWYTGTPMTIQGFTYKEIKYFVNGEQVTADITDDGAKLTAEGLDIRLYYIRNPYPYKVQYLEQGTGEELSTSKIVEGEKYGAVVSENAIDIANYDLVSTTPQNITIQVESDANDPKVNIITFYYKEKTATINYVVDGPDGCGTVNLVGDTDTADRDDSETVKVVTGAARGATAALTDPNDQTYKFVGWYDEAGDLVSANETWIPTKDDDKVWPATTIYYAKFEYNLTTMTIKKAAADGTTIGADETFIFTVKGEGLPDGGMQVIVQGTGEATISGLTVGETYTVVEDTNWSWRYSSSCSHTDNKIVLDPDATSNEIVFTNTKTNYQWLTYESTKVNTYTEKTNQGGEQ